MVEDEKVLTHMIFGTVLGEDVNHRTDLLPASETWPPTERDKDDIGHISITVTSHGDEPGVNAFISVAGFDETKTKERYLVVLHATRKWLQEVWPT